ncbi:MAG TPA: hypothetical protein VKX35_09815 [Fermentimonas sp.]|nr:hypothetical protein [Fermentimonas sp.]
MTAKIGYNIPTQKFELFRDVIGLIIKEELANQYTLTSDPIYNADVYIERFVPYNASTELPAVNISFKEIEYTESSVDYNFGENLYAIEITTKAHESADNRADFLSSVKAHKLIGAISYILSSIEYRTLGLPPGTVMGTSLKKVKVFPPDPVYNPTQSTDELSVVAALILFGVKAADEYSDVSGIGDEGVKIEEIFTNMQIEDSGEGYKILIINNE